MIIYFKSTLKLGALVFYLKKKTKKNQNLKQISCVID